MRGEAEVAVKAKRPTTVDDVAAFLDCDRQTVMRMARNGKLTAVKVGNRWYFPPMDQVADELGLDFLIVERDDAQEEGSRSDV